MITNTRAPADGNRVEPGKRAQHRTDRTAGDQRAAGEAPRRTNAGTVITR